MTPATLDGNDRLALVARFGVGYDNVDAAWACTLPLGRTPDRELLHGIPQ